MKLHSILILISVSIFFIECNSDKNINFNDEIEFAYEIQVLNDIFIDLTKEIGVYDGYPRKPYPPFPIKNKEGEITGYDSTVHKLMLDEYLRKGENYIIEPKSILIAIGDSLHSIKNENVPYRNHLPSDDYISVFNYSRPKNKKTKKIEIDSLIQTGSYKLIYTSLLYNNEYKRYDWFKARDIHCKGKIMISKIHFNEERTLGILWVSHLRGPRSGLVGCKVYIRNNNGLWEIEQFSLGGIV